MLDKGSNLNIDFDIFDNADFSLDEDLHLFDEEEWNFSNEDFEDFSVKIKDPSGIFSPWLIAAYIVLGVLMVGIGVWYFTSRSSTAEYESYMTQLDKPTINYVQGEEPSSDVYIKAGNYFQKYIQTIGTSPDLTDLNNIVVDKSALCSKYTEYMGNAQSAYDIYDSNAQALKKFACSLQFGTIDKIVKKDDIYYVYVNMIQPTKESIREYLNMHKYNLMKHFNGVMVTENDLCRFLLETMDSNSITCESLLTCLQLVDGSNGIEFKSDVDILDICTTNYNYAVNQLTGMIGSTTSIR